MDHRHSHWPPGRDLRGAALALLAGLLGGCAGLSPGPEDALRFIGNSQVQVGVLPQVGGRVVILRRPGGPNLLKEDRSRWNEPEARRPVVSPQLRWTFYYGQIVWLAPQAAWWTQQDLDPGRRDKATNWPPDPYLVFGPYTVTVHEPERLVLVSPASPVSGLQLTKTLSVGPDGTVVFAVSARNLRTTPVRWALWPNLRLPGRSPCYVPAAAPADRRPDTADPERYPVRDGLVTLDLAQVAADRRYKSKLQVAPTAPWMAGFVHGTCLVVSYSPTPAAQLPPGHAAVEIYNWIVPEPRDSFVELEHFGPYLELAPQASCALRESWRLFPAGSATTPAQQRQFLAALGPFE